MKFLVIGSSGHLGEALMRTLRGAQRDVAGIDVLPGSFTTHVGSIVDRDFVRHTMHGITTVFHTATLHKPHVATHTRQQFVDVNVTGTLNLLEESARANVQVFISTSTTSTFGDTLVPPRDQPAAWITEDVVPIPKNIYGVTKCAAEDLCQLFHRNDRLPCIVLRTSRFFPEADDNPAARDEFDDANLKTNEFLYRRADVEDIVSAHLLAAQRAGEIGFAKYIVSATTPFTRDDLRALREDAASVVEKYVPEFKGEYEKRKWRMTPSIDRVYVNERARRELGWNPKYDFRSVIDRLHAGQDPRSALAQAIGSKGYHRVS